MQNLAKRQWGASLTIKESADMMINWCIRAREKNILRKKPPQIYYAYIIEDTPPLQYFHSISSAFKYSQKDVPYIDQSRDTLLRCLSVALKAHYFIFPNNSVAHEPYFFVFPTLSAPATTSYGLIYKIEKEDKSIVVCERELNVLFPKSKVVFEFPVIVIEDSFKWFHMKNWSKIKQHANIEDRAEKPWLNKKLIQDAKDASTKAELEQYATLLDVPYDIKDAIKPLGIEWSTKVKTWYLPKGFDVDSVNEYIEYMKKELVLNNKIIK
jgi:hypothetical protein